MSSLPSPEELARRARAAFAGDLTAPPPMSLRGADAVDSYSHPAPYDEAADEPTDAYFERYAFWGLAHLDPQSWRHYLPQLVEYAGRHPDDPHMVVEALVASLRPPDREPPRLASLSDAQAGVARALLEYLAFVEPPSPLRDDAIQALDEWWWPRG